MRDRMILDELRRKFPLDGLSEPELQHLNRVWHRLMPWPDAVSGLNRLRSRYALATLSNGNVSLLMNMATTWVFLIVQEDRLEFWFKFFRAWTPPATALVMLASVFV